MLRVVKARTRNVPGGIRTHAIGVKGRPEDDVHDTGAGAADHGV